MRRQSHRSAADQGEAATSLGMEFWLLGWESCSRAHPVVCIGGRAGNQQIFRDTRLDVLNSVVKLLLAAGLALQSKNIYFILSLLAGTTLALHLNGCKNWDHNEKYHRILLLNLVEAYRS